MRRPPSRIICPRLSAAIVVAATVGAVLALAGPVQSSTGEGAFATARLSSRDVKAARPFGLDVRAPPLEPFCDATAARASGHRLEMTKSGNADESARDWPLIGRLFRWRRNCKLSRRRGGEVATSRKKKISMPTAVALAMHLVLRSARPVGAALPPDDYGKQHQQEELSRVVPCNAVSLRPGASLEQISMEMEAKKSGQSVNVEDFTTLGKDGVDVEDEHVTAPGKEQRGRKAKNKKAAKKKKASDWDYDDGYDDDEGLDDFADATSEDVMEDSAIPGAGASGTAAPAGASGGRIMAPAGAASINDKAKSNIQAKVILIAGGGYLVSCFGYEGFQWNKEQKKVETSIEILGEQAKELFGWGENETATDAEISDELKNLGNETDTGEEGSGDGDDVDDDDDGDDEDEPPPRRSPRKPIKPPRGGGDDDDGYGGSSGPGSGKPSSDDLDRLNRMFKK